MCTPSNIIVLGATIAVAIGSMNYATAATQLDDVIEGVHQHELLYSNVEVRLVRKYAFYATAPKKGDSGIDDDYRIVTNEEATIHFVKQDGMFHVEIESTCDFAEPAPMNLKSDYSLRKFNGRSTRLLTAPTKHDAGTGRIVDRILEDGSQVEPHNYLLQYRGKVAPLSVYLRGHNALASVEHLEWNPRVKLDVEYVGEEDRDGLHCHVVQCTSTLDDVPKAKRVIWLASERNFIPVYQESYSFNASDTIPRGEGRVTDWMQIEPGVWFPGSAEITVCDRLALRERQERVVAYRYVYTTESVALDPNHQSSFFEDLPFLDGTAVYEISNGAIAKSYRVGAPETSAESDIGSVAKDPSLLWANTAVIVAFVAALFAWRRGRASAKPLQDPSS